MRKAVLVFDRGFRRVSLIRLFHELCVDRFVIRLMTKVQIRTAEGYQGLLSAYPLRRGQRVDLGLCSLRADAAVTVRVVGIWQYEEDEPWWLATGLKDNAREVVAFYDRRTSIEEQFRDGKGARYGAQMKWTHFARPESLDRLWLLWALSAPIWTVAGLLAYGDDHTVLLFSRSKGPRRSLLSIGMQAPPYIKRVLRLTWKHLALLLPPPVFRFHSEGEKT